MKIRVLFFLAVLSVMAVALPETGSACSVCVTGSKNEASLFAYYMISILLTVLALSMLGGVFFLARKYNRAAKEERDSLHAAGLKPNA